MAHIYYGNRAHFEANLDVATALASLGDEYWALLEFDVISSNIDCLIIKPEASSAIGISPSVFIMTEIKHVTGRIRGLVNAPWTINRYGIESPLIAENSRDDNPWQQTLRALNDLRDWFTMNQTVFLDGHPVYEHGDIKMWPTLLIVRSDSDERHLLPIRPGTFGSFAFSIEQWIANVINWRPSVGITMTEDDLKRLVSTLGLNRWDAPVPQVPLTRPQNESAAAPLPDVSVQTGAFGANGAHAAGSEEFNLSGMDGLVRWATGLEQRIASLERQIAASQAQESRGQEHASSWNRPVSRVVERDLTDDERTALLNAVGNVRRLGHRRNFPEIVKAMNESLGYELKDRQYNGFQTATSLFEQARKEGVIVFGPNYGAPSPSIFLPTEYIPVS